MSTEVGRPSSEPRGFEAGAKEREQLRAQTRVRIVDARRDAEGSLSEQRQVPTVGNWIREAQGRLLNPRNTESIEAARKTQEQLPRDIQNQWGGNLRTLEQLMTARINSTIGDPIGILRYVSSLEDQQLPILLKLCQNDPAFRQAAENIQRAFTTVKNSVGDLHPAIAQNLPRAANRGVTAQESNLLRTGGTLVAGTIAVGTGILAFFAKPADRNPMFPVGYGLAAAAFAGYGNYSRSPTERLDRQVDFLTQEPQWRTLQARYGIRGRDWATLAERYYGRDRSTERQISNFLQKQKPTELAEQRAAILALGPQAIHPQLTRMLDPNNPAGRPDLAAILGYLKRAVSTDARNIAINCILSPPSA